MLYEARKNIQSTADLVALAQLSVALAKPSGHNGYQGKEGDSKFCSFTNVCFIKINLLNDVKLK